MPNSLDLLKHRSQEYLSYCKTITQAFSMERLGRVRRAGVRSLSYSDCKT